MTAEQTQWAVVPTEPTQDMIDQGAQGMASFQDGSVWPDSWSRDQVRRMRYDAAKAYRYMLAAAPPFPPGDAVEAAQEAWSDVYDGLSSPLPAMRAALAAAYPEMQGEIERLRAEVKAHCDSIRILERERDKLIDAADKAEAERDEFQAHLAKVTAERDDLRKRISEAPVYFVPATTPDTPEGWGEVIDSVKRIDSLRGHRLALVKMEDGE